MSGDWSSDVCSSDLSPSWGRRLATSYTLCTWSLNLAITTLLENPRGSLCNRCDACDEKSLREPARSEEHTSELQSPLISSYAVFCLKKDLILFFGKSVAGSTLILLLIQVVSFVHTLLVLPASGVSFVFPYTANKFIRFTQIFSSRASRRLKSEPLGFSNRVAPKI